MKYLYLDNCVYNRPFDDKSSPRVRLESEAVCSILSAIEQGKYFTVGSEAHEFENDKSPFPLRRERVAEHLKLSRAYIVVDTNIEMRALELTKLGFRSTDALHIACAENSPATAFLTCDDKLATRARKCEDTLRIRVSTVLEFVAEEGLQI